MTWQPISTAPRDGTEIVVAYYDEKNWCWMFNHDRWWDDVEGGGFLWKYRNPTHWAPLPSKEET